MICWTAKAGIIEAKTRHKIDRNIPRPWLRAVILCLIAPFAWPAENRPPLAVEDLRSSRFDAHLRFERELGERDGYSARVASYLSSGLRLYALVAVPLAAAPRGGYPVLIMNHGFHPNPKEYGIRKDGRNDRPGDYYWDFPGLYAREGYLVLMPDYRGHNESEGFGFTDGFLASNYYTIDVLNLLAAVPSIELADQRNIFMWGHSLGGEVTLRALLATDRVRAASIWAPVAAGTWEQAFHYSRMKEAQSDRDDLATPKDDMLALERDIEALGFSYHVESAEPLEHLQYLESPLVIHHARGDASVPYEWSERLAARLYRLGKPYLFYSYDSPDHLLQDGMRAAAVQRDLEVFSSVMSGTAP